MSFLGHLKTGGDAGEIMENELEAEFLFLPNSSEIFLDDGAIDSDPLGDFVGGENQNTEAQTVTLPSESKNIPLLNYQDVSVFNLEMKRNIEDVISESVHLLQIDPREYHPFYLRVFKFLVIGQHEGHISKSKTEELKIWSKYDVMAANQWEKHKRNPSPFTGNMSPYATYILTKKVYINGVLVTEMRDENEISEMFNELGRKTRKILSEITPSTVGIESNLTFRLKFLNECCTITYPEDCVKMNKIWAWFCREIDPSSKVSQPHTSSVAIASSFTNDIQETLEDPQLTDFSSFDPPPSPLACEEEIENKCVASLEIDGSKEGPAGTSKIQNDKEVMIPKKRQKVNFKVVKVKAKDKKTMRTKKEKKVGKKISKSKCNVSPKKSKLAARLRFTLAKKVLRKGLRQTSFVPLKQEKALAVLEKKISDINEKIKRTPRRNLKLINKSLPSGPGPAPNSQSSSITAKIAVPEFSMCDECGQTYRTHYLSIHKDSVHNSDNVGRPCPICLILFKRDRNMWSHFLTAHMPDHLNPTAIAMQIEPVVQTSSGSQAPAPVTDKQEDLKDSMELEQEKSWNCEHCSDKPFATKATLQRHLYLVHGEGNLPENKAICPECPKTFKEKAALTQHIKRFHQGIVNICSVEMCGKKFQTPGKLWKHKVDHHGIVSEVPDTSWGSVQCENCGENCLQGKQYINHVKNQHPEMLAQALRRERERRKERTREIKKKTRLKRKLSGIKSSVGSSKRSLTCPECGRTLKDRLERHLSRCHGSSVIDVKKYVCPIAGCDKQYMARVSLRIHISDCHDPINEKIIQGQLIKQSDMNKAKAFQCTLCGWMIASKYECMMHIVLAHPHCFKDEGVPTTDSVKCPHCDETAETLDLIRSHVELVHSEGVWRCPHPGCQKVILSPVDLQEHFYIDHGENNVTDDKNVKGNKKRDRGNRRIAKGMKRKRALGHGFRRGRTTFHCYRCSNVEASAKLLDAHVKKAHKKSYWPCKECGVMCYTERSQVFHQRVLCKVKKRKVDRKGVVGYDHISINCPICESRLQASGLSLHLKGTHGVIEDGDLWKCEYCTDDEKRQNFKTREYWLAHMDDCHGDKVSMDELIEVAKKINSKAKVDIQRIRKSEAAAGKGKGQKEKQTTQSKKQKTVQIPTRSRSGRLLKRKRAYFDDSDDDDAGKLELDGGDSDNIKGTEENSNKRTGTRSTKRLNSRRVQRVVRHGNTDFDIDEVMSNVPIAIRKLFSKQCAVRVRRLSMAEIEMKKRLINNERSLLA